MGEGGEVAGEGPFSYSLLAVGLLGLAAPAEAAMQLCDLGCDLGGRPSAFGHLRLLQARTGGGRRAARPANMQR